MILKHKFWGRMIICQIVTAFSGQGNWFYSHFAHYWEVKQVVKIFISHKSEVNLDLEEEEVVARSSDGTRGTLSSSRSADGRTAFTRTETTFSLSL
jgi:hypothetical protein